MLSFIRYVVLIIVTSLFTATLFITLPIIVTCAFLGFLLTDIMEGGEHGHL